MAFITAVLAFAIFWVTTVLYLRSAHRLVHQVRAEQPDFWRNALGCPRFVAHHRRIGLQFQFRFYLQPLLPFLRWVLAGSPTGLPSEILDERQLDAYQRSSEGIAKMVQAMMRQAIEGE